MKSSLSGGCLCGAVRYAIVAEPITLYACHCTDCQTASGASFILAMRVPNNGIRITQGDPKPYERSRSDGRKKNIFRCPQCLSALWGARIESAEYLTVYVGTLDDTSSLRPVGHIWTCDAQPWISIPEGELVFEQDPPNMRIADENFKLLKRDPRHPSLHLKKVGRYWSARVGIKYRARDKPHLEVC